MTLSDPSKWLKMGDFAKNEKKNKENGKNQVRHVGRLLTVFNKFVKVWCSTLLVYFVAFFDALFQELRPVSKYLRFYFETALFVMLLASSSAKNLVQTYLLRWIPEVFITSGTYHLMVDLKFISSIYTMQ